MSCDPERVTGYVDEALEPLARAEIEAHLTSCPACREQARFEVELRGSLRTLAAMDLPPRLARTVREGIGRRPRRWLRAVLPLAAMLILSVLWVRAAPPFVAWQLARDHLHCFRQSRLPAKMWSSDPDRVAAWFRQRGTDLPMVPESSGGVELVGARYCSLLDRAVAHLYYSGDDVNLSLFVVSGPLRMRGSYRSEVAGQTVHLLRVGGRVVALVSASEQAVDAVERRLTRTLASGPVTLPLLAQALRVTLPTSTRAAAPVPAARDD